MSLTRKMLKAMGIEDDKIEQIIDAHTETVDGLKADLETAKDGSKDLSKLQRQLEQAQADLEAAKKDGWQDKYTKVKKEFDDYKDQLTQKEAREAKENAYRELLEETGVSEKRLDAVLKVSDLDEVELVDGKIKDAEKVKETIRSDWADFIVTTRTQGASTPTPPANGTGGTQTKDEIMKIKDPTERQNAIASNMDLFRKE